MGILLHLRDEVFLFCYRNYYLMFGLLSETILAVFLSYCPGLDTALRLFGLRVEWWCTALSFSLLILVYDEIRKWIIRRNPGGERGGGGGGGGCGREGYAAFFVLFALICRVAGKRDLLLDNS